MKIELRTQYLSTPRYGRYLLATAHDKERAKKLYHANIRLAQAFHPLLSQFEVVLRNSLNTILTAHFNDPDWIIHQKIGFMHHHSLRNSHYYLRSCVQKTEAKLVRKAIPVTSGKIIADQTFGFWLAFFLSHHYALVAGQPIHIFPHKPLAENRASIYDKLNDIKNFRNRINHCEPICFVANNIDCAYTLQMRATIYRLVAWINPSLIPFFESIDNIQNKTGYLMGI
jgi:hypothetical protein